MSRSRTPNAKVVIRLGGYDVVWGLMLIDNLVNMEYFTAATGADISAASGITVAFYSELNPEPQLIYFLGTGATHNCITILAARV